MLHSTFSMAIAFEELALIAASVVDEWVDRVTDLPLRRRCRKQSSPSWSTASGRWKDLPPLPAGVSA